MYKYQDLFTVLQSTALMHEKNSMWLGAKIIDSLISSSAKSMIFCVYLILYLEVSTLS